MSEWINIRDKIVSALTKLYQDDECLFTRNDGRGLAERCIVFRFAHYLQNTFDNYFVDCDFNSATVDNRPVSGKPITNMDGESSTNRYVDIIIHKRFGETNNDLICFEIKKWNNRKITSIEKDKNNLNVLTSEYGYKYGFHVILGKNLNKTTVTIFRRNVTERLMKWEAFKNE